MQHKAITVILLLGSFLPFCARAESPASTKDTFLYGECIHLGQQGNVNYGSGPDVEIKLAQIGVTSTRDDLNWEIQKASSPRTIPQSMSKLGYSMANIQAQPLLILKGDSTGIPEGQPQTPETRAAYAAYAQAAATALKSVHPIFEIWNEWNLGAWNNKKGPGTPENYVALAKETYLAIKKIFPSGLVLAGAVGDDPAWKWTLKTIELGVMNYADGLSVHAYNHCMDKKMRTGDEILQRLVHLHDTLKQRWPEKEIPIYLTEYGWPTEDSECGGVAEDDAAANVAQIILAAPTYSWLKGAWHYELLDQATLEIKNDPLNREHHFGHYRADRSLKPSGCVAKTAWDFISEFSPHKQSESASGVTMVTYGKDHLRHIAVWNSNPAGNKKRLFIPKDAVTYDLCGYPKAKPGDWVELSKTPYLIEVSADSAHALSVK